MVRLSIDFGTTNSLAAIWDETANEARTLTLPSLSLLPETSPLPLIPSRIFIKAGDSEQVLVGAEAPEDGDLERLFTSFKRGLGGQAQSYPRMIDGQPWDDARAGVAFLTAIVEATRSAVKDSIDELVLTAPVASFENYLKWLRENLSGIAPAIGRVRVIDECTAAALGYAYRQPGELILVFDFGGGTLDVSLVRMPTAGESGGILLGEGAADISAHAVEARVIAKAGRILGGDDVDTYLLKEVVERFGLRKTQPAFIDSVRRSAERAKITLTQQDHVEIAAIHPETGERLSTVISRDDLEEILDKRGVLSLIRRTVESTLRTARQVGIFPEDIKAVLMVGGSSLIPAVGHLLRAYFDGSVIHPHKPFEAVAHGALELSGGLGVSDFIYHAYAVRILDPISGTHHWEEIIPAGTRYPKEDPLTLILAASRDKQPAIELVIGEVEEEASSLTEVVIGGRSIRVVGSEDIRRIVTLNDAEGARTMAVLDPAGKAGVDRLEVAFTIDRDRFLRVSACDLQTRQTLLANRKVIELR